MNEFQAAVAKTRSWLDRHFDGNSASVIDPSDVHYYMKTPYLLAVVSLRAKGARVAK